MFNRCMIKRKKNAILKNIPVRFGFWSWPIRFGIAMGPRASNRLCLSWVGWRLLSLPWAWRQSCSAGFTSTVGFRHYNALSKHLEVFFPLFLNWFGGRSDLGERNWGRLLGAVCWSLSLSRLFDSPIRTFWWNFLGRFDQAKAEFLIVTQK